MVRAMSSHGRRRHGRLLLLRLDQLDPLPAPAQPATQLALPRRRRDMSTQAVAEQPGHERQQPGIDGIGLGQLARGPSEVPGLTRVDPGDPQACIAAGLQQRLLIAARRLHHGPLRTQGVQPLDQLGDAAPVVGKPRHAWPSAHRQVQAGLAHIDACCRHAPSRLQLVGPEHRIRPTLIGSRATSSNCSGAGREIRRAAPAELRWC